MANAREQMQMIEEELARVRAEILKLQAQEQVLSGLLRKMEGSSEQRKPRKRSPAVKPLVLEIMDERGAVGATTGEVNDLVRERIPSVGRDTVGSVLSRLKADGALEYVGDRYFVKKHAPRHNNFTIRAVE